MLEIDPFDASVYKAKGNSLRKKGLYDLAEQSFFKAIELNSCYYEAYSQLGFNYCDAELIDKAKELIKKMKAHDNRNVTTHYIGILLEYIEKF